MSLFLAQGSHLLEVQAGDPSYVLCHKLQLQLNQQLQQQPQPLQLNQQQHQQVHPEMLTVKVIAIIEYCLHVLELPPPSPGFPPLGGGSGRGPILRPLLHQTTTEVAVARSTANF